MKAFYNVLAFGKGVGSKWVHPSNLWAVNPKAGYYVIPFNTDDGNQYSAVRWSYR